MNINTRPNASFQIRQVEGEGLLRMLLVALAVAMPLGCLAYLKIQHLRLSYEISELKTRIQAEEEHKRQFQLDRSHYLRDEEIQAYARKNGLQPRKQSYLIPHAFTSEDQKMAKLRPVSSNELKR